MLFTECARAFRDIEQVSSRIAITRHLAELYAVTTGQEAAYISYLLLGMIEPPYKSVPFSMAENSMSETIARVLEVESAQVKRWYIECGDLGEVVARHGTWQVTQELSLTDVYERLVSLAACTGTGSQEQRKAMVYSLLRDLHPQDAAYVVRIIVGKLRLGFSEMTIIDALSWYATGSKSVRGQIEDAYNRCADIGRIAKTIRDEGVQGIDHVSVVIGVPIRPAAAERLPDAHAIIQRLGTCAVQPKFDGFRIQVHLQQHPRRIALFSRNLLPMNDMFPDIHAALECFLDARPDVSECIIEGEAMAYNTVTGSYVSFQETVKRRRKHGVETMLESHPLHLVLFDVLWLNGTSRMSFSETERYEMLSALITPEVQQRTERLRLSQQEIVDDASTLEEYFYQQLQAGFEGVMAKRIDATYQPGKRNFNWIKLKRHEEGSLEDTIDAAILGYYYGKGKRAAFGIGALLVGVFNPSHDRFETIAKIGTGLTDAQWVSLKHDLDVYAVTHKPAQVVCDSALEPDVWCTPERVAVIRADDITQSPVHTAGRVQHHEGVSVGYALRFPRFMGLAADKKASDATTVNEIKHLFANQATLRGAQKKRD